MKKFLGLSVILLTSSLLLNSCEAWEDESYHPEGTDDEVELTGTWKLTELKLENAYDFNGDGTANADLLVETGCYQNELLEFNLDNTGISTSNSYANIIIDGETFSVECIEETEETAFEWEQVQDTVTITIDGQDLPAVLAGNKLKFTVPDGFYAGSGEGDEEITEDFMFTYTKEE